MPYEVFISEPDLRRMYVTESLSTVEIGRRMGVTRATVRRKLRNAGIARRSLREAFAVSKTHTGNNPRKREKCNFWKGGTKMQTGYLMILKPEHPQADRFGYVMEHRLIAEKIIGRLLVKGEEVHHINHDRLDNRQENLQVMTKSAHMAMHMRERHRSGKMSNRRA